MKRDEAEEKETLFGIWVTAFLLTLLSFFLIGLLLALGREMVARLDDEITRGVWDFNLTQGEERP
ncbi:hypothetical protein [Candidatus Manganitrophus noduliformans]|uniref:Uncharacterized protein n=1 Tax=Candidatus Manganitrophus noduliformans TaxID=2606439 RepID=A0A7X6DUB1_9BACT|nr:hypothetical protein [Candidatus Manganitrophus noduliformans]NKE73547.1 hypothetical protein [Candidatus Manganitrophus noduliformans]